MAQMVKAVRMIFEMESYYSVSKQRSLDIEIEDDAPTRKQSLEEIDALEVQILSHSVFNLFRNI
jgi:hypothetical protein